MMQVASLPGDSPRLGFRIPLADHLRTLADLAMLFGGGGYWEP